MRLWEKQVLFARLEAELRLWALASGYQVTLGEAYRPPETAAAYARDGRGIANSLHIKRLAVDWCVFINGEYVTRSEALAPIGEKWKSMHPLCRWGGDFRDAAGNLKPDGNHFSIEHDGVK